MNKTIDKIIATIWRIVSIAFILVAASAGGVLGVMAIDHPLGVLVVSIVVVTVVIYYVVSVIKKFIKSFIK